MAHAMTAEQIRSFLSYGHRTGKVATIRADGRPHVAPVWFILDGDDVVFMTGASTVKGRNLLRDPRLAMAVDDEEPPFGFVTVEGTARLISDPLAMLALSVEIARRYVGDAAAETFGARNAVPGELLVRVRPDKTVAFVDLAD